jgi:hypothetical protein
MVRSMTPSTTHASPEEAVHDYFTAGDTCSSRHLRSAFDPAAHMQWVDRDGKLHSLSQLAWWQRLDAISPCRPALERSLVVADREGPLALVEASSRFATHRFHDLLLLAETPGGWRIVDKVFEELGPDEQPPVNAGDDAAIRAVVADKIEAHAVYDPALLASSHLPECSYTRLHVDGVALARFTLSEAAAGYAARRDRGETDRDSPWRVLLVVQGGRIAGVKLDVMYRGVRHVDHLLLLRTEAGWRIAAAAWGDPAGGGAR